MSTPFTPAPVKPTVPLSVLESLDIRPGTIAAVDDVAGSKKLIKLTVSFGDHRRTILAGMKQERAEPHVQGHQMSGVRITDEEQTSAREDCQHSSGIYYAGVRQAVQQVRCAQGQVAGSHSE